MLYLKNMMLEGQAVAEALGINFPITLEKELRYKECWST